MKTMLYTKTVHCWTHADKFFSRLAGLVYRSKKTSTYATARFPRHLYELAVSCAREIQKR